VEPHSRKAGKIWGSILRGLWPLAAALVLRKGLAALLCAANGVSGQDGTASKTIFWFQRDSVRAAVVIPVREWLTNYLARAFGIPALAFAAVQRRGQPQPGRKGHKHSKALHCTGHLGTGALQDAQRELRYNQPRRKQCPPIAAAVLQDPQHHRPAGKCQQGQRRNAKRTGQIVGQPFPHRDHNCSPHGTDLPDRDDTIQPRPLAV